MPLIVRRFLTIFGMTHMRLFRAVDLFFLNIFMALSLKTRQD